MTERDIFIQVLQATDPVHRATLVHELCYMDDVWRQNVELILDAHRQAARFLKLPLIAVAGNPLLYDPLGERPAMQVPMAAASHRVATLRQATRSAFASGAPPPAQF